MNLYVLGTGEGLISYIRRADCLTSFFRNINYTDRASFLYRDLIRFSSTEPFLVLLTGNPENYPVIRKIKEFLPEAAFLCLCLEEEIPLLLETLPGIPNLFYSLYHLPETPPQGLIAFLHRKQAGEIFIPSAKSGLKYAANEILFVESDRHRVRIHTFHHEDVIYYKLSELSKYLGPQYIRCHQSYIVNKNYISRMEGSTLVLENDCRIPVSRAYLGMIRHQLSEDHANPLSVFRRNRVLLGSNLTKQ